MGSRMGCSTSTSSTCLQLAEEQQYLPLSLIVRVASISGNLLIMGFKCRKRGLGGQKKKEKSHFVTQIEKKKTGYSIRCKTPLLEALRAV